MSFAAGIFCLLYYLAVCQYVRRWNSTFSRFWLLCGVLCIWYGLFRERLPWQAATAALAFWTVLWMAVAAVWIRMLFFGRQRESGELEYLIVLGAKVDRTRITSSLKLRLDRAYIYAAGHRNVKIVVSGGQGRGEDIPEAEAMKEYLVGRGIEKERIFPEDRSSTTEENLRFTARLIPDIKEKKTGVVTNSFHIYRAWLLGKREGYQRLFPVSAKSEPVLYLNYMVREALAVLFLPGKGWRNRH